VALGHPAHVVDRPLARHERRQAAARDLREEHDRDALEALAAVAVPDAVPVADAEVLHRLGPGADREELLEASAS